MRKLRVFKVKGKNSLNYWWKFKNPFVVAFNFLVIELSKYIPSLAVKRGLLRLTGIKIERNVAVGFGVRFDIFWPELITLKENCIVGYNSTILCHEFLIDSLRLGEVEVGKDAMIGANTTILPGIRIGERAIVSACSLVNKDVPAGAFVGGVPVRKLRK